MKRLIRIAIFVLAGLVLGGGLLLTPSRPRPAAVAVPAPAEPAPPPAPGRVEAAMVYKPPAFRNSRQQRSEHVLRSWQLIGGVGVNIVTVNLSAKNVRFMPGFAAGADPVRGYFPLQNFYHIVQHYQPRVAINGTYFHLLNGSPTGPMVRHGKMLYDGRWGTTISLDDKGGLAFRYQSGTYGRHRGWEGITNAISTGPTLVRDGKLWLHPRQEGFRDPAVLGRARRSALGLTWDNRLVLVTVGTRISLNKLGNIMLRLNCKQAANLDGGSSSALYSNGEYITKPNRKLSNVLLIYD